MDNHQYNRLTDQLVPSGRTNADRKAYELRFQQIESRLHRIEALVPGLQGD